MDESEAIRRARQGDREAFRWLVERDGDLVRRTAYLLVHDRALAEDLAQDAFLAAWQGLRTFRTETGFRPWIVRILVNRVTSQGRKRRLLSVPLDLLRPADEPVDASPGPPELSLRREDHRELDAALRSLPADWQQALVLRYYTRLSVPEIAETLGVPEGTVKSRLHRALERLRSTLGEGDGHENGEYGQLPRGGERV